MNTGSDAAEQVVRLSLEGVEVAVRVAGFGAKNIAALLAATLRQENKTSGKARLTTMLRSGRELTVFSLQNQDLKKFAEEAKRYGILYCALKPKKTEDLIAEVDIIVPADDAARIERIVNRFRMQASVRVDKAEPDKGEEPFFTQTGDDRPSKSDSKEARDKPERKEPEMEPLREEKVSVRRKLNKIRKARKAGTLEEPNKAPVPKAPEVTERG